MNRALDVVEAEIQKRLAGDVLKRRSGNLAKSVRRVVKRKPLSGKIGPTIIYAAIHEFGGIIRARRAKALAFTISGRTDVNKKGDVAIDASGSGDFVMVQQVTMPKRPYMAPSRAASESRVARILGNSYVLAVRKHFRG